MGKLNFKKWGIILTSILIFLFLLLLSYKLCLFFIEKSAEQKVVLDFLTDGNGEVSSLHLTSLNSLNSTSFGNLTSLGFTYLEISHLQDVKKVMFLIDKLFLFFLVVSFGMIFYLGKDMDTLKKIFLCSGISTIIGTIFLLLSAIFIFPSAFTIFHQVFFPQGNWIFPVDSLLIKIFPETFFKKISEYIFLVSLLFGMVLVAIFQMLHNHFLRRIMQKIYP
ncbi:DUF1461 domain-containing protein [Candidatus Woesearchaeota archaeon]|nr:DUF1461 domain-containing protein [Candidatus Woesearchaeota archaeon]